MIDFSHHLDFSENFMAFDVMVFSQMQSNILDCVDVVIQNMHCLHYRSKSAYTIQDCDELV